MLGVIIKGKPHPPITHIGPAARASHHTSEDLVEGIIAASAGETLFKNYRPYMRNVFRRVKLRVSRIYLIHYRAHAPGVCDGPIGMGLFSRPGPLSAFGGFSASGTLRQLISALPSSSM